ncbi:MAG: glutathione S-transferase family protein [Rhizobiaceae bacterium]|nr:glutathione S-transferase family protein [Rhizobiaceae bacterium]
MPIIETANKDVQALKGLHLYHFWLSSCSQRVRMVLAEKNLEWVDHPVDISAHGMEHTSEEYQSIHPDGLVPAVVHDGQVIIESIDIIDYLDQQFPKISLHPESVAQQQEMHQWMRRADAAQHSIKTLTHEFLFKPDRMRGEQLARFVSSHKNQELCEFLKVFGSDQGFPREEIESELKLQHDEFVALDLALKEKDWLVGSQFSLADVAWIPNVRRLDIMHYPLNRHPNLAAWYERIKARPSYQTGIADSEVPPAMAHFKDYCLERASQGTGVSSFSPLAD